MLQAKNAAKGDDSESESDDEDDEDTEYGCVINGLKAGSYAEKTAAGSAGGALRVGMALRRVNNWSTGGQETDDIIDQIAKQTRRSVFPLFFCDFQEENAEIAPFFVHFTKK